MIPKINTIYTGGFIKVYDTTGSYDAEDNPGGYGGENPDRADVFHAKVRVFFNGKPYQDRIVTAALKEGEGADVLLAEVPVSKDGSYYTSLSVNITFGNTYHGEGSRSYVFDSVKMWTSKFWAHLARQYDSHVYRWFSTHCIWLNTHIDALGALSRLNKDKEFLMLLRLVEKRILVNKRHLSAPGSFMG